MIKKQTEWYKSKGRELARHTAGMRAINCIPEIEKRIEINQTKIKAFGRHRLLREHKDIEETFLRLNEYVLNIARKISNAYLCKENESA